MRFSRVLLVLLLMVGLAGVSAWRGWISLPPQWNPWAPLDVRAEPNLLTRYKLMRLSDDPQLCEQALSSSGLRVARQADSPDAKCPLTDALRVQGGDVVLSSSFLASCRLAVSFALFEHHALQPAAQAVYGQAVTRVDHLGSFACRNVYGRENGRLSQHASANALDIAGFRLADGRTISVLKDWPKDNQDARFLRQVRDGSCDVFSVVLSPDYNAAHRNHFHLDVGPWWVCR
ncbi:extensin family protein [Pseudomonas sp. 14P_8.1_Bac3]|uniref:extensin-like domain-containing protein n=1 Tax=Pseudomonas sp. 14P_8.1_Bac3 TaxID=2971621 RepID=UPI0021C7BE32|nr:extensin family protein [Pseudomonas sp. 14P_8.1_Bac3]MCU1760603.1 extensin family protein [Pseudomonas sp. 14P_8.1_Bac3]